MQVVLGRLEKNTSWGSHEFLIAVRLEIPHRTKTLTNRANSVLSFLQTIKSHKHILSSKADRLQMFFILSGSGVPSPSPRSFSDVLGGTTITKKWYKIASAPLGKTDDRQACGDQIQERSATFSY